MSSAGKTSSSSANTKMPTYRSVLSALVAAATLIDSARAHMVLTNPVPYGKPQTNPLKPTGEDYPCQQTKGVYDPPSTKNEYTTGGEIDVAFGGSASHGGGSCQFAISTDKEPSLNTVWQVIYSIEGGCPLKGASSASTGGSNYTVPIPSSVAAGDYTFAWTWYNRVGNRELYMNCAPITIKSGGSTKRAVEARKANPFAPKLERRDNSTLPDLWLANICNHKCDTVDNMDAIFPSPGAYTTGYAPQTVMASESCSCARSEIAATATAAAGSGAVSTGSASSGSSGSGSSGSSGSDSSGSSASDSSGSAASGSVATSAATVAATSATAAASSGEGAGVLSTAVATETVVSTAAVAAATGSSGSSGSSGSTGSSDMSGSSSSSSNSTSSSSGTCSGTIQCSSDGAQFALCGGPSMIYQAVAPGTKCADGSIVAA